VDVRLDEIVLRALEQQPERRYQKASEVKTDAETISQSAQPGRVSQDFAALRAASRTPKAFSILGTAWNQWWAERANWLTRSIQDSLGIQPNVWTSGISSTTCFSKVSQHSKMPIPQATPTVNQATKIKRGVFRLRSWRICPATDHGQEDRSLKVNQLKDWSDDCRPRN